MLRENVSLAASSKPSRDFRIDLSDYAQMSIPLNVILNDIYINDQLEILRGRVVNRQIRTQ